jgi:YD repeat-containing protein
MVRSRLLCVLSAFLLVLGVVAVVLPVTATPAVAAAGDAVVLDPPALVHSTGAELHWSRFAGPSAFDRYEIWRGSAAGFATTAGTLLATVRDVDTTSWVDTTAAPPASGTRDYWYRIVVNGTDPSADQKASVPTDGLATLNLQPGPAAGDATYTSFGSAITTTCYAYNNYGGATNLRTGSASNTVVHRPLLRFDLRDIPPGKTVSSATLKLSYGTNSAAPGQINVHRVTRAWTEGKAVYPGACDGSGADWTEAAAGQPWTSKGGDYDTTTVAASVPATAHSASGGTNSFTVTSLVQGWVNGTNPNLGMLVKLADEAIPASTSPQKYFDYYSDDYTTASLRPQLLVTFADGSHARGPNLSVASPAPNAKVSGSAVTIAAAAGDDGAVTKVDLAVDGTVLASKTAAPYTTTWNSTTATNQTHTITATATDDAGTATTVSRTVTVDNTAAPTLSIFSPTAGQTVSGTTTITATPGDDGGVTKVEFYAEGRHLGDKTAAPYTMAWNTLDPLYTSFDGPATRTVTVKAYDGSGNVTTRSVDVSVDNTTGTRFSAAFDLNAAGPDDDYMPPFMVNNTVATSTDTYSGGGGRTLTSSPVDSTSATAATTITAAAATTCPSTSYCPTVTVTNTSQTAWKGGNLRLWYRWFTVDGVILYEGPAADTFPQTVQPGQSKTLPVTINPPALPTGIDMSLVRLRLDVYDTDSDSVPPHPVWFSQFGNQPVDNAVLVARDLDGALGLERYYGYTQEPLGGGPTAMTNIANGNLLVHWTPWSEPGRGLDTVLGLTYNSLEDHSRSPFGNNWSLSMSTLTRFGEPLDVHPNKADTISGRANKYVEFVDGDGTTHRFDGVTNADGSTTWTAPPGVHLYLRTVSTDPAASRYWALSRPDHVTFYYDADGFPTAAVDKNGNATTFTESPVPAGEDPGGPAKRITAVTDAGGRPTTISYYSKDEAKSPHVRGNIKDVTDHGGHVLHADYYEDGNLLRVTQVGGTTATGAALADRSWVFTYTTSAGDAAAIPLAADRANPDPRTPNQSTRLFSVRDPNQHETTFTYFGPGSSNLLRWRLKTLTDRGAKTTTYAYDTSLRKTTVTDPLTHPTVYAYDTDGKPVSVTNAKNETTGMAWTSDFMLRQVTEPNTAAHTDYTYDTLGDVTSVTDQMGGQTALTYTYRPLDTSDSGQHWSLLATKTSPRGTATTTPPAT